MCCKYLLNIMYENANATLYIKAMTLTWYEYIIFLKRIRWRGAEVALAVPEFWGPEKITERETDNLHITSM